MTGDLNHHFYKDFGGPIALDTVGIVEIVDVEVDVTGRSRAPHIVVAVEVVRARRNYKNKYLYGINPYR